MTNSRVQLSGGFQNDIFHLPRERKIERISRVNRTIEMVQQEFEWMNFLYERGVAVPRPDLKIDLVGERVRSYFKFIDGSPVNVTNDAHWNIYSFEEFGRILGKMHALSKEFSVKSVHRPVWTTENPDVFGIRNNLSLELKSIYDSLMKKLYPFEIHSDTYGIIHNDFHQGNLIIGNDGVITTIDFDDCSFNWFAQDIAVFFYHAYWQQDSFNGNTELFCQEFLKHFFNGYRSENCLNEVIVEQIPIFLKLREIFLYQLFLETWNSANMEDWQTHTLNELEKNIRNRVPYAGIGEFTEFL